MKYTHAFSLVDAYKSFTKHVIYKIDPVRQRFYPDYSHIKILKDDSGLLNGWNPKFFKLLTEKNIILAKILYKVVE